jgi:periplasmic protein TonB
MSRSSRLFSFLLILLGLLAANFARAEDQEPKDQAQAIRRVRISEPVSQAFIAKKVSPEYPPEAREKHIEGMVRLKVEISKEGDVTDLVVISGDPVLTPAAVEAVKQWKYKPYLLNGQPVAVETQVSVAFQLQRPQ